MRSLWRTHMKLGTINQCFEVSAKKGFGDVRTKGNFLKIAFLDGKSDFFARTKPASNLPTGKNFIALQVKMTQQLTLDYRFYFLHYFNR